MDSQDSAVDRVIRLTFWSAISCAVIGQAAAIRYALIDPEAPEPFTLSIMITTLFMSITMGLWYLFFVHRKRSMHSGSEGNHARLLVKQNLAIGSTEPAEYDGARSIESTRRSTRRWRVVLIVLILLLDVTALLYHYRSPAALFHNKLLSQAMSLDSR